MGSVPVANAGLASAINNSISRIGQPLLSAVIFVVVSGSFYAALAGAVPGFDPSDPAARALVQPLNKPGPAPPGCSWTLPGWHRSTRCTWPRASVPRSSWAGLRELDRAAPGNRRGRRR